MICGQQFVATLFAGWTTHKLQKFYHNILSSHLLPSFCDILNETLPDLAYVQIVQ